MTNDLRKVAARNARRLIISGSYGRLGAKDFVSAPFDTGRVHGPIVGAYYRDLHDVPDDSDTPESIRRHHGWDPRAR